MSGLSVLLVGAGLLGSTLGQSAWDYPYSQGARAGRSDYRGRDAEERRAGQEADRRQDSSFDNFSPPDFNIPFQQDFSFSEFGSPFGNTQGFQQFLSGLGGAETNNPTEFSQQPNQNFRIPDLGQNQILADQPVKRIDDARQLGRFDEGFKRPEPVYVPPKPERRPEYSSYTAAPVRREYKQPEYKPVYQPEYKPTYQPQYNKPTYQPSPPTQKRVEVVEETPIEDIKPFSMEMFDDADFGFESPEFEIKKEILKGQQQSFSREPEPKKSYYTPKPAKPYKSRAKPTTQYKAVSPYQPKPFQPTGTQYNTKPTKPYRQQQQQQAKPYQGRGTPSPYTAAKPSSFRGRVPFPSQQQNPSFFDTQQDFFKQEQVDPQQYQKEVISSFLEEPTSYPKEPASYLQEPSSYQQEPASYPKEPASYQQEPASYQQEPASYQQEPASFQKEPATFQQEPASFQKEDPSFFSQQDSFFQSEKENIYKAPAQPKKPTPSYYKKKQPTQKKEDSKKSNFKPPALIERFATPMVEPSLPFQPVPPAQYPSPQHQETEEYAAPEQTNRYSEQQANQYSKQPQQTNRYSGEQQKAEEPVDRRRFISGSQAQLQPPQQYEMPQQRTEAPQAGERYSTPGYSNVQESTKGATEQYSSPPVAQQQPENKQYGKQEVPSQYKSEPTKKPYIQQEYKYVAKNFRAPVKIPAQPSNNQKHPVIRMKKPAAAAGEQEQGTQYRTLGAPQARSAAPQPGRLEIIEVTKRTPVIDDTQEIITLSPTVKRFSGAGGKQSFNIKVKASFNPEPQGKSMAVLEKRRGITSRMLKPRRAKTTSRIHLPKLSLPFVRDLRRMRMKKSN